MSDIFYTNVDPVLQNELNARASAGKHNRTTKDLNFMLGKIASVQIIPYKTEYDKREEGEGKNKKVVEFVESKTEITPAILGGFAARSADFLPSGPNGFLSDRQYTITDTTGKEPVPETLTNNSKRTSPFITSAEISIGDNSMGMMNTATVNITIPNPGRDLDYFESIYLRPGRHVTMLFQHPESAIITRDYKEAGILTDKTLPSLEKLKELDPKITKESRDKRYGKLNTLTLDAVIISFTLDYQPDGMVNASLSMRGPSQLYTDVSMYINKNGDEEEDTDEEENKLKNKTFYDNLSNKVTKIINANGGLSNPNCIYYGKGETEPDSFVVWGVPYSGGMTQRYVTLGFLIRELNEIIVKKSFAVVGTQQIICTSYNSLCNSIAYPNLVSSNPEDMFIPGEKFNSYSSDDSIVWYKSLNSKLPQAGYISGVTKLDRLYPSRFFINMTYIQDLLTNLSSVSDSDYNLNSFLAKISSLINRCTGGGIDLKLITHPQDDKSLLFYDRSNVLPSKNDEGDPVEPYSVPMFANHPIGSIVRDFSFSGKLPSDASNLSYVLNQDPSDLSESDIAPFLSFMYSASVTQRNASGDETIGTLVTATQQQQAKQKYKETHEKAVNELIAARNEFGKQFDSAEKQSALRDKLKQYLQFPTPELDITYQLKAPVIPFDCSFTIDGINGFKYGDVLQFDGLPKRYTANTVYSIVSTTHTVSTNGEWTTQIRCIMRPKIN